MFINNYFGLFTPLFFEKNSIAVLFCLQINICIRIYISLCTHTHLYMYKQILKKIYSCMHSLSFSCMCVCIRIYWTKVYVHALHHQTKQIFEQHQKQQDFNFKLICKRIITLLNFLSCSCCLIIFSL